MTTKNLLSQRKQSELAAAEQSCINAGVQYAHAYERFNVFTVEIDTDEKQKAVNFLLGEMIEFAELDFRMSPIIDQLGNPAEMKSMNYREFKLLQEIIKTVRIKGRKNHVALSQAMKAFNNDGEALNKLEEESKMFVKEYQTAGQTYSKLCQSFGILPEDLDKQVEEALQEKAN